MAKIVRSRTLNAPIEDVWAVVSDPHHLPRWWPRVSRVEAVEGGVFTELLRGGRGRSLRADFEVLESQPPSAPAVEIGDGGQGTVAEARRRWTQQLAGTPFERFLKLSETEVRMVAAPASAYPGTHGGGTGGGTLVTIELRRSVRGFFARFGTMLVRRAARSEVEDALAGLERILG